MPIFHGVDPSDVRKQTGEFGNVFNETCARKTEEERRKWSQALTYVSNIAGEHFQNWDNEANMIEKIAKDISNKLNATPARDFDGKVGVEAHLRKMELLLDLDYDGVKIVGISGPPGIGKSIISRVLQSMISNRFQLNCFMDNLMKNHKIDCDEYGMKLCLQKQLLSKILNQDGMSIHHLGVIQERLYDQKVLIILDDVESLDQLEALANIMWFGSGSRVIVTSENIEILQQHGINDIYHVGFPSKREALMIFCQSAFRQISPPDGFMNLADEIATICGNLPLGLPVLGLLLRGKSRADWIDELPRLKNCLHGRIEKVLKVGYESLHEKDQALFLHIAVFFNYEQVDHVTSMLAKNNLEVKFGLKVLANRHLIHIDHGYESRVVMHRLLQVMARQVISRQEPWKRQILVDAQEICYVLEKAEGNGSIIGVSFDVAEINELMLNARAFERMSNLAFLKVYDGRLTGKRKLRIPEAIEFPHHLRLLHWDAYPAKSLPLRFCIENLVELDMAYSQLEKLWEGTQLLANLREMNFIWSSRLKELPDLSKAKNLESLDVTGCVSLVELPSSIANLQKLDDLVMNSCESLEVIPTFTNLASLECIDMFGCSRLTSFPEFHNNIISLAVTETTIEEVPVSIRHCSGLKYIDLSGSSNLKSLTHLPMNVRRLNLSNSGIEMIIDCIKDLHDLQYFNLSSCKRLTSLPELPCSLKLVKADDCELLERVSYPLNTPHAELSFTNCFKLNRQARQAIIQQSFACGWAVLPGREVPAVFDHRAKENSFNIPHSAFNRFKICVVISPNHQAGEFMVSKHLYHCKVHNLGSSGDFDFNLSKVAQLQTEHLFIFNYDPSGVSKKIVVKFSSSFQAFDMIGCGIQIMDNSNNAESGDEDEGNKHRDTHESGKAFDKDKVDDDKEVPKYESGEVSKDR